MESHPSGPREDDTSAAAPADNGEPGPAPRRPRVTVALGGGGSRGFSHLGVLKALHAHGIPVDSIIGTSIGAIVGAVYALDPEPDRVIAKIRAHITSESFRKYGLQNAISQRPESQFSIFSALSQTLKKQIAYQVILARKSLFKQERLKKSIHPLVGDLEFEDLKVEFHATAVDLVSGAEVMISHGALIDALVASASLPGFFPPFRKDDMLLADLGVINAVPVFAARKIGAEFVIAVDICAGQAGLGVELDSPTGFEGIMRMANIASTFMDRIALTQADAVIRPELAQKSWSDFSGADELIERGVAATESVIPQIQRMLWWRSRTGGPPGGEPDDTDRRIADCAPEIDVDDRSGLADTSPSS